MWSWSSCEMKTHRTSTGSTIENVLFNHSSRTSEQPVSTMTGCSPRMTREWAAKNAPEGSAAKVGINQVSAAMRWASVSSVIGIMGWFLFELSVALFTKVKLY